ncbi:MAG: radical SAM family heme chaperone HemW [Acidimicrobiia bacterium]
MTPTEADAFVLERAAYVHIPFCSAVCPYCDFAVVAGRDDLVETYVAALCREIQTRPAWQPLSAVYFGGGTPSHVDPPMLGEILMMLESKHGITFDAEVSLEANPEDFTLARARALRDAGFNRVSFGAQSFDGGVLADLGRRHEDRQVVEAVAAAREGGFDNVSVDLIYGSPVETDESWRETLERAIALGLDHVSCYALTVERGTPLGRAVLAGAPSPDADVQADRYETADETLVDAGFNRYEVSNWCKQGKECRYNLVVWAQGEYEAYGNGAHGYRNGVRYRNHRRIDAYLNAVQSGMSPRAGTEDVGGWDAELDRLFVGLRRVVGVSNGPGTDALLASREGADLLAAGVIESDAGRLRVGKPLLTDAVHRSVLAQTGPIVRGDDDA